MLLKPIASYWQAIQSALFPDDAMPQTDRHIEVIVALDILEVERHLPWTPAVPVRPGRPPLDRAAIARSFVAKAILKISTTKALIDRLKVDRVLRRICGFDGRLPCEATFSNAFREFAETELAETVHEAVVSYHYENRVVGHVSRDSTTVRGRERRGPSHVQTDPKTKKSRLARQPEMTLEEMLADLPKQCNTACKKQRRGKIEYWDGYKLHLDCGDGGVPLSCVLTSASLNDSQVAIVLEAKTARRVVSLYSLMDAGYDCEAIARYVASLGKVAIIDRNRRYGRPPLSPAEERRYRERTTVERAYGRLKDDFGGRNVRVQGHAKVFAHLMFGILALTAERLVAVFT